MKTAKEKARELVLYHFKVSGGQLCYVEVSFLATKIWNEAKRHALKTVDEIKKALSDEQDWYWDDVESEIEKL